ncbi:hypothetical protein QCA50_021035 [Cerrena zonata]|uniref:Uncharacterized protein n=1 Tax=Cerrena zonata TaxID=2478898 RepID=A0AAW0FBY3_9APHY
MYLRSRFLRRLDYNRCEDVLTILSPLRHDFLVMPATSVDSMSTTKLDQMFLSALPSCHTCRLGKYLFQCPSQADSALATFSTLCRSRFRWVSISDIQGISVSLMPHLFDESIPDWDKSTTRLTNHSEQVQHDGSN